MRLTLVMYPCARVAQARGPIGDRVVHHAHIRGVRVCVSLQCGLGQPRVRVLDPVEIERRGVPVVLTAVHSGAKVRLKILFRNSWTKLLQEFDVSGGQPVHGASAGPRMQAARRVASLP